MRFVGIDPGSRYVGLAVVQEGKLAHRATLDLAGGHPSTVIRRGLTRKLLNGALIFVEAPMFQMNRYQLFQHGIAYGRLLQFLNEYNLFEISAHQWMKPYRVLNHGEKMTLLDWNGVWGKKFKTRFKTIHEAEAAGLAYWAYEETPKDLRGRLSKCHEFWLNWLADPGVRRNRLLARNAGHR